MVATWWPVRRGPGSRTLTVGRMLSRYATVALGTDVMVTPLSLPPDGREQLQAGRFMSSSRCNTQ